MTTTAQDGSNDLQMIFVPPPPSSVSSCDTAAMRVRERESVQLRLQRAKQSQIEYGQLFRKLNIIIDELKVKFLENNAFPFDDDDEYDDNDDDDDYVEARSESSVGSQDNRRKRKRYHQRDSECIQYGNAYGGYEYPKQLTDNEMFVQIGPNGTMVPTEQFSQILWETASATRALLALVFSSDVLATHTLTGKPSPAFRGRRERPPKLQLDAGKTADIIHCVRAKCGCNERDIRAVITTKCADTAKKYKKRRIAKSQ